MSLYTWERSEKIKPRKLFVWPDRENTWKRKFHLKFNKNFVSKSSTLRANTLLSEKIPKLYA